MKYYQNIEVSEKYEVSLSTIQNWINASLDGENNLRLIKVKDRDYILINEQNRIELENLTEASKKYKQKSIRKVVKAKPEFFENYSKSQIAEIISDIEIYSEIPHKYTYSNGGEKLWQGYAERSFREKLQNTVTNTEALLQLAIPTISQSLKDDEKINFHDIGCGDARPVKDFLGYFLESGLLNEYSAIDISDGIYQIAKKNISQWFNNKIKTSFHRRDITKDSIQDILFYSSRSSQNKNKNIILFAGSTIENFRNYEQILTRLGNDISHDDLLMIGFTLDNEADKLYFDFSHQKSTNSKADNLYNWRCFIILRSLNLDDTDFKATAVYEEENKTRKTFLVAQKDICVHLDNKQLSTVLDIQKGQAITVWRHKHHSLSEIVGLLDSAGLDVMHVITSENKANALTICRRKPATLN